MTRRRSFMAIWGLTIAWASAVAGVATLVVLIVTVIPAGAWPIIGWAALGLGITGYIAALIWINQGGQS